MDRSQVEEVNDHQWSGITGTFQVLLIFNFLTDKHGKGNGRGQILERLGKEFYNVLWGFFWYREVETRLP